VSRPIEYLSGWCGGTLRPIQASLGAAFRVVLPDDVIRARERPIVKKPIERRIPLYLLPKVIPILGEWQPFEPQPLGLRRKPPRVRPCVCGHDWHEGPCGHGKGTYFGGCICMVAASTKAAWNRRNEGIVA
jgi:hypothetical protein